MPLYEYQCRSCNAVTDVRHGFDETNAERCPKCGGELARRFSPAGIVFKGSGFYVNDSRAAPSNGGPTSKPAAKTETGDAASKAEKSEKSEASAPAAEKKSEAPAAPKSDTAAA